MSIEISLINTSVYDARISLELMLKNDPKQAKRVCEKIINKLKDSDGHKTRRQMVVAMLNKANKILVNNDAYGTL